LAAIRFWSVLKPSPGGRFDSDSGREADETGYVSLDSPLGFENKALTPRLTLTPPIPGSILKPSAGGRFDSERREESRRNGVRVPRFALGIRK